MLSSSFNQHLLSLVLLTGFNVVILAALWEAQGKPEVFSSSVPLLHSSPAVCLRQSYLLPQPPPWLMSCHNTLLGNKEVQRRKYGMQISYIACPSQPHRGHMTNAPHIFVWNSKSKETFTKALPLYSVAFRKYNESMLWAILLMQLSQSWYFFFHLHSQVVQSRVRRTCLQLIQPPSILGAVQPRKGI